MSIAEHISVFISIIIGLAVGDLLVSFHRLLRARRRVRWAWMPLGVALFGLLLTVNYWWLSFGWFEDTSALSVAGFMPVLTQVVVLFLLVANSLPDEVPADGLDLEEWYFGNAQLYWSLALMSLLLDLVVDGWRVAQSVSTTAQFLSAKGGQIMVLPFLALMIVVRRKWYHALFVAISLVNIGVVTASIALAD